MRDVARLPMGEKEARVRFLAAVGIASGTRAGWTRDVSGVVFPIEPSDQICHNLEHLETQIEICEDDGSTMGGGAEDGSKMAQDGRMGLSTPNRAEIVESFLTVANGSSQ